MVETKKNVQREINPGTVKMEKNEEEEEIPKRGTGRKTGTAKEPTGPEGRLTEEERKKRHKRMT